MAGRLTALLTGAAAIATVAGCSEEAQEVTAETPMSVVDVDVAPIDIIPPTTPEISERIYNIAASACYGEGEPFRAPVNTVEARCVNMTVNSLEDQEKQMQQSFERAQQAAEIQALALEQQGQLPALIVPEPTPPQ